MGVEAEHNVRHRVPAEPLGQPQHAHLRHRAPVNVLEQNQGPDVADVGDYLGKDL